MNNNSLSIVSSIAKRFDTTIFGLISTIEEKYPEIINDKEKWKETRDEMLNKGNKEKRLAIRLLEDGCDIVQRETLVWKKTSQGDKKLRLVEVNGNKI